MINRQRRHQPGGESGSSPSSGSHSSPRHHAYNIADGSVDEEANKGKKSHFHMFRPTLSSFRRVCLNPRATLPLKCSGTSTSATPAPHQGRRRLLSQFLILSFVCVVLSWTRRRRLHHPFRHQSAWSLENSPLLIKLFDFSDVKDIGGWHYHTQQFHSISSLEPITIPNLADYGGLTFSSLSKSPPSKFRRTISPDDYMINEEYKRQVLDKNKAKKGFDDIYYQQPEEVLSLECRRQNWQGLTFPTCNDFHEVDLSRDYDPHAKVLDHLGYYDSYRISHGAFRDTWVLGCHVNDSDTAVLKSLRIKREFNIENIKAMTRDTLVMERLTSSPRIVNVFGHCGTSTIVEPMCYEVEEVIVPGSGMIKQKYLDKFDDVHPMNNYTIEEKLEIALQMAESLADLHGYEGGVIVHDDVQLCQWLRNANGTLKLGDFNRAEMMEWNDEKQQYCKHENGLVNGNYRAPEEMRDDWLDEKIDVFSFGNNIYGLLTGLWVFYENDDDSVVQDKVKAGERAYIDERYRTRSFIEGKLIDLMERCWIEDPNERVDIFEAVRFLRQVTEESKKQKTS